MQKVDGRIPGKGVGRVQEAPSHSPQKTILLDTIGGGEEENDQRRAAAAATMSGTAG